MNTFVNTELNQITPLFKERHDGVVHNDEIGPNLWCPWFDGCLYGCDEFIGHRNRLFSSCNNVFTKHSSHTEENAMIVRAATLHSKLGHTNRFITFTHFPLRVRVADNLTVVRSTDECTLNVVTHVHRDTVAHVSQSSNHWLKLVQSTGDFTTVFHVYQTLWLFHGNSPLFRLN
ncbi:hypothetical protein D3C86_1529900 [compost metagenome]